jgi:hypothetical protein
MVCVPNGIVARDVFVGGFTQALAACGATVIVGSQRPAVLRGLQEVAGVDQWVALNGHDALHEARPDLVVCPTPRYKDVDIALASSARRRGIRLMYAISSWDNLNKGRLPLRDATVAVWSPAMRDRAVAQHDASATRVHVVGPLQFTPYLDDPSVAGTRNELAARFGFDAGGPIVTVATAGVVRLGMDETTLVEAVLDANPAAQVVFRIHPDERERYGAHFAGNARVRVDYQATQLPGEMPHRWYMGRDHYRRTAVLLAHTDLLLSIGTTMHLEAALFGTPSLIAGFIPGETPEHRRFLDWVRVESHLHPILDADLIPYAADAASLRAGVERLRVGDRMEPRALRQLGRRFIGPADAQVPARLAAVACEAMESRS